MLSKLRYCLSLLAVVLFFTTIGEASQEKQEVTEAPLSPQTRACIACHEMFTPGIVQDWLSSRHSRTEPEDAMKKPLLERRISTDKVPEKFAKYAVGCYECHSQNPKNHKDNFEHMGFKINVVVSPNDCKTCHLAEAKQFAGSKKAHAYKNLMGNPIYLALVDTATGLKKVESGKITSEKPSENTLRETCLACHGTKVESVGMKKVSTKMGELIFPDLTNWPNQGVGRVNPDGSTGACTACHPRHSFSIEIARKPHTCSQCHLEPDVPAWDVYDESKHGDIFFSLEQQWEFNSVPWTVGKDFKTPTCAVCHNSLIVSRDGKVIAERTHDFGSRLWIRLFGLIYSNAQPKSGDTTIIKNKDGLPLPTTFMDEPASEYLINKSEREKRLDAMKVICNSCHNIDWINGHFAKLDSTIRETNEMTLAATKLMLKAWSSGIEERTNPFDEAIEKMWIKQWLFYSNSIRYSSAMTGAPDYATFKNGWWYLNENLNHMKDWIELKEKLKGH
jgi:hydroxylamine dehydrogenase